MARIFISYSRKDEPFARRVAEVLSGMGADVWIDVEDIPVGMKWSSAIQQGLDSGQLLIVVISPDSMASRNVEDEWQYYLDHGKPIVPVLLEPAKVHFQLNRLQYIDFHTQPFDIAINQLYAELRRKGLSLEAPAQPQAPAGSASLPDFDNLSPEEIDRVLAQLQKRRGQYDTTAAVPYPSPQRQAQASSSNRLLLAGGGVIGLLAVLGIGFLALQGFGTASTTPPPSTQIAQITEADLTATAGADLDQDGLVTHEELVLNTDPNNPDTDGDGLLDGEEVNQYGSDPMNRDTDGDTLDDRTEVETGCLIPTNNDTDGDGKPDNIELAEGNPCVEPTATNPPPTATPETPGLSAANPIVHNWDWNPISRTFNGVEMVLVPTGRFVMGTAPNDIQAYYRDCENYLSNCRSSALFDDEGPTVEVVFNEPFWIGRYEMTNAQTGGANDNLPRTGVTWHDALAACEGYGLRLPTEREWEYAARGPESWAYPWGNDFSGAIFNYCDARCEYNWRDSAHDDGFPQSAPVGSLPDSASWVDAKDMAGNVWEWTSTVYRPRPGDGYEDPGNISAQRTLKGSSWNWILHEGRGAARSAHANNFPSSPWYGFRCAKDFDPADLA